MADSFQLKAIITGVDKLSPVLESINKKLKSSARQFDRDAEMGLKIGAAASAVIGATSAAFAQQEQAVTNLKAAMMDNTGAVSDSFQKIADQAIKLGDKLPGTTADFENMMTELIRQGIPAQDVLNGIGKATAYMAVQMRQAPDAMADSVAMIARSTRTLPKDMMKLGDSVVRGFYKGLDIDGQVEFFSALDPVMDKFAKQAGAKAVAAAEPFAVMLHTNQDTGASGNALRQIISRTLDTKKVRKGSRAAHENLIFTRHGEFLGIDNMLAQLEKLRGLSDTARARVIKDIWGTQQAVSGVLNILIKGGRKEYASVRDEMAKQASLQQRVDSSLGTLTNTLESAQGTAINAAAAIGAAFAPQLEKVSRQSAYFSEQVERWSVKHPERIRMIAKTALAIGAVATAFKAVAIAERFAAAAMEMDPLVIGVTAIAAIAVNWDKISPALKNMEKEFSEIIHRIGKGLMDFFKNAPSAIAKTIEGWAPDLIAALKRLYQKVKASIPDPVLKFLAHLENDDSSVRGAPTPPITASKPIITTVPPMPDYTRPGWNGGNGNVDVTITHTNAPAGTRMTAKASGTARVVSTDVGYSPYSKQYAAAMTGE